MKRKTTLLVLAAGALAGCISFRSGDDLFASGRDARVFNPATGRYDWPDDPPQKQTPRRTSDSSPATPTANAVGDGRVYNPEKRGFEWSDSAAR